MMPKSSVHMEEDVSLISHICYAEKVFSILGTSDGVAVLAEKLVKYGMGDVLLYVGENLSYENEKIFAKPASELTEYKGDPLSVICAVNEMQEHVWRRMGSEMRNLSEAKRL